MFNNIFKYIVIGFWLISLDKIILLTQSPLGGYDWVLLLKNKNNVNDFIR